MVAFEQVIRLQLARFSPEEAKRRHIAAARKGLSNFLARQDSAPEVAIETDGRPASSEDSVRPFGVIVYRFTRMREIASFALAEAERLSPVKSGRFRRSWFLMVEDRATALDALGGAADVVLTNDQPYARKVHVGAHGFERYANPGIVEKVRQLVLRRFRGQVDAQVEFLTLSGGHALRRSAGRRKDRQDGAALTYPALRLTSKRWA